VQPDGLELQYVQVDPITSAMRRMVRNLEFDICEMALSTYLCAKSYGKPSPQIPCLPQESFHHGSIVCNVNSGIKTPKDLEGRTVGVTAATRHDGSLGKGESSSTEYGVDLNTITWAATGDEQRRRVASSGDGTIHAAARRRHWSWYSADVPSSVAAHVIVFRSTPYWSEEFPLAQRPVVTV